MHSAMARLDRLHQDAVRGQELFPFYGRLHCVLRSPAGWPGHNHARTVVAPHRSSKISMRQAVCFLHLAGTMMMYSCGPLLPHNFKDQSSYVSPSTCAASIRNHQYRKSCAGMPLANSTNTPRKIARAASRSAPLSPDSTNGRVIR